MLCKICNERADQLNDDGVCEDCLTLTRIETWCPVFSGFYNTLGDCDQEDELNELSEEHGREIKWDDIEWDNRAYERDVSVKFVEVYASKIKEVFPSLVGIAHQAVVSPREYNFTNDGINIEVYCTPEFIPALKAYITSHKAKFEEYLHERYIGYDGFISHYPNHYEGWVSETKDFTELGNHYLGSILQFVACIEDHNDELEDYYYEVMESVWVGTYITVKPVEVTSD